MTFNRKETACESVNRPLRILMMIHTPWSRDLGAPRTQLELAEEWRKSGHTVEKFSIEDAFPRGQGRLAAEFQRFSPRATAFVQKHGREFDIIDANQTNLLVSKRRLNFRGLLVTRSVGLVPAYVDFFQKSKEKPVSWKSWVWAGWERYKRPRSVREANLSFEHADVINVSNQDDLKWMRQRPAYAKKAIYFPFGLTAGQFQDFQEKAGSSASRKAAERVVFIGSWDPRKGSREWPQIFAELKQHRPKARLRLLGTTQPALRVLEAFAPEWRESIEVIPSYRNEDLPQLLSDATVGAFPSHLEGFGYAVLEKLAAGLPVVAYDSSGPQSILAGTEAGRLTFPGNIGAMARGLREFLELSETDLENLCQKAWRHAEFFTWKKIAKDTLRVYMTAAEELQQKLIS